VNPIGQGTSPTVGSGVKQIQDTNLNEGRKLPFTAGDMWVTCIRFCPQGLTGLATINDVQRLFRNYVLQFLVNGEEYLVAPLELFPAGGGPYGIGQLSTAMLALTTTSQGAINGLPSASAVMPLPKPIGIGQGETFVVQLLGTTFTTDAAGGTTLGTGLLLKVILEGDAGQAANQ
jgi:hypothetical protein